MAADSPKRGRRSPFLPVTAAPPSSSASSTAVFAGSPKIRSTSIMPEHYTFTATAQQQGALHGTHRHGAMTHDYHDLNPSTTDTARRPPTFLTTTPDHAMYPLNLLSADPPTTVTDPRSSAPHLGLAITASIPLPTTPSRKSSTNGPASKSSASPLSKSAFKPDPEPEPEPARTSIVDLFRWKASPTSEPHSTRQSRPASRRASVIFQQQSKPSLFSVPSSLSLKTAALTNATSVDSLAQQNNPAKQRLASRTLTPPKSKPNPNLHLPFPHKTPLKKTSSSILLTNVNHAKDLDYREKPTLDCTAAPISSSSTKGPSVPFKALIGTWFSTSSPHLTSPTKHDVTVSKDAPYSTEYAKLPPSDYRRLADGTKSPLPTLSPGISQTGPERATIRPRPLLALEQVSSSLRNMLSIPTDMKRSHASKASSPSKRAEDSYSPISPLSPYSTHSRPSTVSSYSNNLSLYSIRNSTTVDTNLQAPSTPSSPASNSTEQTRPDHTERLCTNADTATSPQTPAMTPRTYHSAVSSIPSTKRNTLDMSPGAREDFRQWCDSKDTKPGLASDDTEPIKLRTSWLARMSAGWRRSATSMVEIPNLVNAELDANPDSVAVMVCNPKNVCHIVNLGLSDNAHLIRAKIFKAFEKSIPAHDRGSYYFAPNSSDLWRSQLSLEPPSLDDEALVNYIKEASTLQNPFPSLALVQAPISPLIQANKSPTNLKLTQGLIGRARSRMYDFFIGARPPMELLADQLLEYFPNIENALNDEGASADLSSIDIASNDRDALSEPQTSTKSNYPHSLLSHSSATPLTPLEMASTSPAHSVASFSSSIDTFGPIITKAASNCRSNISVRSQNSYGTEAAIRAHPSLTPMDALSRSGVEVDALSYIRDLVRQSTELQSIHRAATRRMSHAMFLSRRNSQMPGSSAFSTTGSIQSTSADNSNNDVSFPRAAPAVPMSDAVDALPPYHPIHIPHTYTIQYIPHMAADSPKRGRRSPFLPVTAAPPSSSASSTAVFAGSPKIRSTSIMPEHYTFTATAQQQGALHGTHRHGAMTHDYHDLNPSTTDTARRPPTFLTTTPDHAMYPLNLLSADPPTTVTDPRSSAPHLGLAITASIPLPTTPSRKSSTNGPASKSSASPLSKSAFKPDPEPEPEPARTSIVDLFRWKASPTSEPHSTRQSRPASRRASVIFQQQSKPSLFSVPSSLSLKTAALTNATSVDSLAQQNNPAKQRLASRTLTPPKSKPNPNLHLPFPHKTPLKKTSSSILLTNVNHAKDLDYREKPTLDCTAAPISSSSTKGPSVPFKALIGTWFSTSSPHLTSPTKHDVTVSKDAPYSTEYAKLPPSDYRRLADGTKSPLPTLSPGISQTGPERATIRPRPLLALEQVSSSLRNMLSIPTDMKRSHASKASSPSKRAEDSYSPISPLSPYSTHSRPSTVSSYSNNLSLYSIRNSTTVDTNLQAPSTPSSPASNSTEQTRPDHTERLCTNADTATSPQTPAMTPRTYHSAVSSIPSTKRNTLDMSPGAREDFRQWCDSKDTKPGLASDDTEPIKLRTSWLARMSAGWRRSATSMVEIPNLVNAELDANPDSVAVMVCNPKNVCHIVNLGLSDNAHLIRAKIFKAFEKSIPAHDRGSYYFAPNSSDLWRSQLSLEPPSLDDEALVNYIKEASTLQNPFPSLALVQAPISPLIQANKSPTNLKLTQGLIGRARSRMYDFFIGARPPMELLADQLLEYFPNIENALNDEGASADLSSIDIASNDRDALSEPQTSTKSNYPHSLLSHSSATPLTPLEMASTSPAHSVASFSSSIDTFGPIITKAASNCRSNISVRSQNSYGTEAAIRAHPSLTPMDALSRSGVEVDALSYIRDLVRQSTELQSIHRAATRRMSHAMFLSRRNSQMPGSSAFSTTGSIQSTSADNSNNDVSFPRAAPAVPMSDAVDAVRAALYAQSAPGGFSILSRTPSLPYRTGAGPSPRVDIREYLKNEPLSLQPGTISNGDSSSSSLESSSNKGQYSRSHADLHLLLNAEPAVPETENNALVPPFLVSGSGSEISLLSDITVPPATVLEITLSTIPVEGMSEESGITNSDGRAPFKWVKGKLIGEGSYGRVYHGLKLPLPNANSASTATEFIAIKQVDLSLPKGREAHSNKAAFRKKMVEALQRELEFLQILDHTNIVRCFGHEFGETAMNVFLEYVDGGTISSMTTRFGMLPVEMIQSFTCQILLGLEYMHGLDIIHRDIKGANILVDGQGVVKISDFGISKRTGMSNAYRRASSMSVKGSTFWMAPEMVRSQKCSAKIDIWSTGCVVVEMISGHRPWKEYEENAAFWQIGQYKSPPSPDLVRNDVSEFLTSTFEINPEERPTASELLRHAFVDIDPFDIDFEALCHQAEQRRLEEGSGSELGSLASVDSPQCR
ncbi:hypothetical protein SeMB42_g06873 [Synchytrium endobioticum]|uniref:Protein kinase domain-containing protein n=1 Tax=Synchytrium endobioticum TaxID=286115 RepID=A0A507CI16_9FUNG|nr:hypothetical protein SeMB42_g06873 [Synchytrium endobioticum]